MMIKKRSRQELLPVVPVILQQQLEQTSTVQQLSHVDIVQPIDDELNCYNDESKFLYTTTSVVHVPILQTDSTKVRKRHKNCCVSISVKQQQQQQQQLQLQRKTRRRKQYLSSSTSSVSVSSMLQFVILLVSWLCIQVPLFQKQYYRYHYYCSAWNINNINNNLYYSNNNRGYSNSYRNNPKQQQQKIQLEQDSFNSDTSTRIQSSTTVMFLYNFRQYQNCVPFFKRFSNQKTVEMHSPPYRYGLPLLQHSTMSSTTDTTTTNNNNNNNDTNSMSTDVTTSTGELLDNNNEHDNDSDYDNDVPRLTERGGYTHTAASKAKIAAANKGKVPWNKGQNRSDEVRARIAAGVRAKNRERFLFKLQLLNVTEDQYIQQQQYEQKQKQLERNSRRTSNGGYRPTNETRIKISTILKEKYSRGEIQKRTIDPTKVRRGFTHTMDTKKRISDKLRQLWLTNTTYRDNMIEKSTILNSRPDIRQKISVSLKEKWQTNTTFRQHMVDSFYTHRNNIILSPKSTSNSGENYVVTLSHRERISQAMKLKWQDEEYRTKALQSFRQRTSTSTNNSTTGSTSTTRRDRSKSVSVQTKEFKIDTTKPLAKSRRNNNDKKTKTNKHLQSKLSSSSSSTSSTLLDVSSFPIIASQPKTNPKRNSNRNDDDYNKNNDDDDDDDTVVVRMLEPLTNPRITTTTTTTKGQQQKPFKKLVSTSTSTSTSTQTNTKQGSKSTVIKKTNNTNKNNIDEVTRILAGLPYNSKDGDDKIDINKNNDSDALDDDLMIDDPFDELMINRFGNDDNNDDDDIDVESFFNEQETILVQREMTRNNNKASSSSSSLLHGSVDRLQEERPDLYELLYGEDDDTTTSSSSSSYSSNHIDSSSLGGRSNYKNGYSDPDSCSSTSSIHHHHHNRNNNHNSLESTTYTRNSINNINNNNINNDNNNNNNNKSKGGGGGGGFRSSLLLSNSPLLGDENLDTFDPYGLDDH